MRVCRIFEAPRPDGRQILATMLPHDCESLAEAIRTNGDGTVTVYFEPEAFVGTDVVFGAPSEWFFASDRLLNLLESLGLIPVARAKLRGVLPPQGSLPEDDPSLGWLYSEPFGPEDRRVDIAGWSAIELPINGEVIDPAKSEISWLREQESWPDDVDVFGAIRFVTPPSGVPPLFRIPGLGSLTYFVTENARFALESAGMNAGFGEWYTVGGDAVLLPR